MGILKLNQEMVSYRHLNISNRAAIDIFLAGQSLPRHSFSGGGSDGQKVSVSPCGSVANEKKVSVSPCGSVAKNKKS